MERRGSQDGATIRALRMSQRRTATEFAGRVGISRNALYNIENGLKGAGIGTLIKIARELGVSVNDLIRGSEDGEEAAQDAA